MSEQPLWTHAHIASAQATLSFWLHHRCADLHIALQLGTCISALQTENLSKFSELQILPCQQICKIHNSALLYSHASGHYDGSLLEYEGSGFCGYPEKWTCRFAGMLKSANLQFWCTKQQNCTLATSIH